MDFEKQIELILLSSRLCVAIVIQARAWTIRGRSWCAAAARLCVQTALLNPGWCSLETYSPDANRRE